MIAVEDVAEGAGCASLGCYSVLGRAGIQTTERAGSAAGARRPLTLDLFLNWTTPVRCTVGIGPLSSSQEALGLPHRILPLPSGGPYHQRGETTGGIMAKERRGKTDKECYLRSYPCSRKLRLDLNL